MVVAAPALGALAAFAAMCFLVFLYYAYGYSLGAFLQGLSNFFRSIGVSLGWFGRISFGFIADGIDKVNATIRDGLGWGIIHTRSTGLYLWHYAAYAIREVGDAIANLAEATEHALSRTVTVTIPRFLTLRLAWAVAHVRALERTVAHLPRRTEVITYQTVKRYYPVIVHRAAAIGAAIPLPRIKTLERETTALEKWIKAHAPLLTVVGATSLLTGVMFKRLGLGWLRCKGVNRTGKWLCGLSGLIEAAAADALTAFAAIDLCWFANGVMRTAESMRGLLLDFVDFENALIGRCGGDAAKPLVLAKVSRTPVVDGLSLKAL